MPGGQINDPSPGLDISPPFLPATPPSLSQTLVGLFELTRLSSRALGLLHRLLPELQKHKDTARRGGPRTQSKTTNANLDCGFAENALFTTDP